MRRMARVLLLTSAVLGLLCVLPAEVSEGQSDCFNECRDGNWEGAPYYVCVETAYPTNCSACYASCPGPGSGPRQDFP